MPLSRPRVKQMKSQLAGSGFLWIVKVMSAQEIIAEFKGLPPAERAQVAKFVLEQDDSWIPESFKQGMADAEAGRFTEMEMVLNDAEPPKLPGQ